MTGALRTLRGEHVVLEPLGIAHARPLAAALSDLSLHRFIGGAPLSPIEMEDRVRRLEAGRSPDGSEDWCNWAVRCQGAVVGTVQATVDGDGSAAVAWVVAADRQGRGYAREAAALMVGELRRRGVVRLHALIHPQNIASGAVARSVGLRPGPELIDGEVRWTSPG
ncbi:GNAT family N-acetyltransferase [Patulibacter minatonensis]|uniref:GNAT family N-acetyltransferase n=1 Tax=Patulibacter minatonensis TaxID=298163 RepID=UPI00047B9320|nr:GNAT family N-acetyltransferase [Patulibacter minatonensis]